MFCCDADSSRLSLVQKFGGEPVLCTKAPHRNEFDLLQDLSGNKLYGALRKIANELYSMAVEPELRQFLVTGAGAKILQMTEPKPEPEMWDLGDSTALIFGASALHK